MDKQSAFYENMRNNTVSKTGMLIFPKLKVKLSFLSGQWQNLVVIGEWLSPI